MFPGGGPSVDFYRADADRHGGSVLELGCGTGHKLIPIASDGRSCVGLDSSSDMLAEAPRKAEDRGVTVEYTQGTGGADGVSEVLRMLGSELDGALALAGAPTWRRPGG